MRREGNNLEESTERSRTLGGYEKNIDAVLVKGGLSLFQRQRRDPFLTLLFVVVIFIDFQQRIHHEVVGDQDARKQNIVIDEAPTMKKNGASYRSFQLYVSLSSLSVSDLKD